MLRFNVAVILKQYNNTEHIYLAIYLPEKMLKTVTQT